MGKMADFRHNRFKAKLGEDFDVTVTAIVRKAPPVKSILGDKDRVVIYLNTGTHSTHVALTEEEIDGLIFELSRLPRFHDKKNHAVD